MPANKIRIFHCLKFHEEIGQSNFRNVCCNFTYFTNHELVSTINTKPKIVVAQGSDRVRVLTRGFGSGFGFGSGPGTCSRDPIGFGFGFGYYNFRTRTPGSGPGSGTGSKRSQNPKYSDPNPRVRILLVLRKFLIHTKLKLLRTSQRRSHLARAITIHTINADEKEFKL